MKAERKNLRSICWLVAVMALWGWVIPDSTAHAQGKPVLVVSVAGIDSLLSDVGYLADVAGAGQFGQTVLAMSQPYTKGLDTGRPIGVVVNADGTQFNPLGFVPVKDLKTLLSVLPPQVGEARDAGGGVLQLQGNAPIFLKEQNGWAFVGQNAGSLGSLPASPEQLLQGLDREYDLAIRIHMPNIPEFYRQLALSQIKTGLELQLQQQADGGELQRALLQNQVKQLETLFNEVDQLTLGFNLDSQSRNTYLDVTVTALEGTKAAEQMAALTDTKSAFAGLLSPEAAVTMNVSSKMTEPDIQQAIAMMHGLRETAKREIDNDADLPDQKAREVAKELLDGLFDLIGETIKTGKIDGAAAVTLSSGSMTALVGTYIADGTELESSLKKLIELAKNDPDFPGVQLNADEHAGVRFHTMSIDVPPEEDARKVFGDRLDVAVGIGQTSVYLAVGKDGLSQLKKAIDQSGTEKKVPPFEMKVALGQILRFASTIEDNPQVAAVADALEQSQGRDHVLISGKPIKNGMTYRFQVEEGVLKAIGQAAMAARSGGF